MRLTPFILLSVSLSFSLVFPAHSAPDVTVRVNIAEQLSKAVVFTAESAEIHGYTSQGWQKLAELPAQQALVLEGQGSQIKSNLPLNQSISALKVRLDSQESMFALGDKWYRGEATILPSSSGLKVINTLSLEKYLYSVIPSEMPASWPMEALKSQAVAARTYALSHMGTYAKEGYDLKATTASQVYQGMRSETASSHKAVKSTRGKILTYHNKPIHAYFHSTSGGFTESGSELWANFPYLKAVHDFDQASPKYTWSTQLSQRELKTKLAQHKLYPGDILRLEVSQRTQSGRAKFVQVMGKNSSIQIKGTKLRQILGLNSTFINIGNMSPDGKRMTEFDPSITPHLFQISGRGWGHGLGMSQWGARQMALNGHHYKHILAHYYPGTTLNSINQKRYQVAQTP